MKEFDEEDDGIDWEKSSASAGIGPRYFNDAKREAGKIWGNLLGHAGVKFFQALTTKDLLTENGMPTHSSSGSFVVDLFYEMGGYRNGRKPLGNLVGLFYAAFGENPNLALKCLFNLRDPRGGMGERLSFRVLLNQMAKSHPQLVRKFVHKIPEFGRWDDVLVLLGTPVEVQALELIRDALANGEKLCAKWMPRENKSHGDIAIYLAERFGLTRKEYRIRLAAMTEVVETEMCQRLWGDIKFRHVPSQAMKKYRKAFAKHEQERFAEYLEAVKKGTEKINTATLTPVEIVHQYTSGVDEALEVLWANLPDTVPANISFLPICDVSGSMNGIPMDVSISLGIYLAQRNKSIFKNAVITFSQNPQLQFFGGKTLWENMQTLRRMDWGMNTNLEAVFALILYSAIRAKLSQEDMPTHLMIISDMQFDACILNDTNITSGNGRNSWQGSSLGSGRKPKIPFGDSALEMIDRMYAEAGYKRPNIFFWNVDTAGGIPAKMDDKGVGLISGYSPNLLRSVLSGDLNPIRQVEAILNNGRYDFVNEIV